MRPSSWLKAARLLLPAVPAVAAVSPLPPPLRCQTAPPWAGRWRHGRAPTPPLCTLWGTCCRKTRLATLAASACACEGTPRHGRHGPGAPAQRAQRSTTCNPGVCTARRGTVCTTKCGAARECGLLAVHRAHPPPARARERAYPCTREAGCSVPDAGRLCSVVLFFVGGLRAMQLLTQGSPARSLTYIMDHLCPAHCGPPPDAFVHIIFFDSLPLPVPVQRSENPPCIAHTAWAPPQLLFSTQPHPLFHTLGSRQLPRHVLLFTIFDWIFEAIHPTSRLPFGCARARGTLLAHLWPRPVHGRPLAAR